MTAPMDNRSEGLGMYDLVAQLFPICRSITGDGVRRTLEIIKAHIPLETYEVPTGTKAFDWTVPKEWNIRDAYVLDPRGEKVIDFQRNNLHVLGYSTPVDKTVTLAELQEHLHSLPEQSNAIPYVTSYYEERWGFCVADLVRNTLSDGEYRVVIDSELQEGHLTYGELVIPGSSSQEVLLSTYVCHPSMANNELSGPAVATWLAKWIAGAPRRYTYRLVFIPETIGSIVYLSRNLNHLKEHVIAGFNVTCVGDDRAYSFLPSRNGGTLADRVALNVLQDTHPEFKAYSFLERGIDERQYCSPGVDLPVVSVMRSKYGCYPEYHTSLDNLELVSPQGLQGAFNVLRDCLEVIERNDIYRTTCLGEPQLGRRGLYPTLSTRTSYNSVRTIMDVLAYADGSNDLLDVSERIGAPVLSLLPVIDTLVDSGLLSGVETED